MPPARKPGKSTPTYTGEVLRVLACEFSPSDHATSERKLKRRLREKKLGPYDQDRIDAIRRFKDDLMDELHKYDRSPFHLGPHGKYASREDWDTARLLNHLQARHPKVPKREVEAFLPVAIYLYYLR